MLEYSFGIVVDASMNAIALVVDHERPALVKYCEDVVEKKLRVSFQASAEVVLKERPTEVKYAALVVEKKLLAALYASADVVDHARPTLEKYVAEVVEKKLVVPFQKSALVVEKKNPLSMEVRYDDASDVVATTLPCAFVESSAFGVFVMASAVVVAFENVLFPVQVLVSERRVDDAAMSDEVEKV